MPVPVRVRLTGVLTVFFYIVFFLFVVDVKNSDFGLVSAGDRFFVFFFLLLDASTYWSYLIVFGAIRS